MTKEAARADIKEALPAHPSQDRVCSQRLPARSFWRLPGYRDPMIVRICLFSVYVSGVAHWMAPIWQYQMTRVKQNIVIFTGENIYVCFHFVHLVFTMETWQDLCLSLGSRVAPTEASKSCQCILNKSNQEHYMSIMEKTQSLVASAPQQKCRIHL